MAKYTAFVPHCSNHAFHHEDWAILLRHGRASEELTTAKRAPQSDAQRSFAELFLVGGREPDTYWEQLWKKYLFRVEWEQDSANASAMAPPRALPENPVGSRRDFEKLHARDADRVFFTRRRRR